MSSLHEEIANHLTQEILRGQYRAGERIPSERDLATRFKANRGAVREAIKKVEQLGLAKVQPGGARVVPIEQASLEVIGHMLAVPEGPDVQLVDQILEVMNNLVQLAASATTRQATDEQIEQLQIKLKQLINTEPEEKAAYLGARVSLMTAFMEISDNLACRIISRSLMLQLAPQLAPLHSYIRQDHSAAKPELEKMITALASRDSQALTQAMQVIGNMNRVAVRSAILQAKTPANSLETAS